MADTTGISGLAAFLCGTGGGVLLEIIHLYGLREAAKPAWLKTVSYWIITALMIVAGGGVAFVYARSSMHLNYWAAVQLGASTPLLFRSASHVTPRVPFPVENQ